MRYARPYGLDVIQNKPRAKILHFKQKMFNFEKFLKKTKKFKKVVDFYPPPNI